MRKILKEALLSLLLFGVVLLGFSRIDWLAVFHLKENVIEEKLGKLYWELFSQRLRFVEDEAVLQPLDSLLNHLCTKNGIRDSIKLHLVESSEVNAFAFPDRHLVVYTALIDECSNEMELSGVMAHEIAHIEKGHVMKKLIKEVGLTVLAGMVAGNDGGVLIGETAKLLSSTAYDRALETEADDVAVSYLLKAQIDPSPFADFLYRLSQEEDLPSMVEWISTHPDSQKRSSEIWERAKRTKKSRYKQVIGNEMFEQLKLRIAHGEQEE